MPRYATDSIMAVKRPVTAPRRQTAPASRNAPFGGNQAALRRLATSTVFLQPKLNVGAVNHPLEHEADRIADQVMRMAPPTPFTSSPPRVSRKCDACEAGPVAQDIDQDVGPIVSRSVAGGGARLDPQTQDFMEQRFDRDFGQVRVHTGPAAMAGAAAVNARAFTVGRDIVFADGAYQTGSDQGRRLLAHELVHTVQQGAAGAPQSLARAPAISDDAVPAMRLSPACPYAYGKCGGQKCTHPTSGYAGHCEWGSGCNCYENPRKVMDFVAQVVMAALLAIGVVIALDALIALVACFLSGACEVAVLVAALGYAGAMVVVGLCKTFGGGGGASGASSDQGAANDPAAAPPAAAPQTPDPQQSGAAQPA